MTDFDLDKLIEATKGHVGEPWWADRKTGNVEAMSDDGYPRNVLTSVHFSYEQKIAHEKLIEEAPTMLAQLLKARERERALVEKGKKLDRFARLMMGVIEEIEQCTNIPEHITDAVAVILADWSKEE